MGATAQGEDRIHRPGQSEQCNYYYLWSDRGIDEMIQENQKEKQILMKQYEICLIKRILRSYYNDKNWVRHKTKEKIINDYIAEHGIKQVFVLYAREQEQKLRISMPYETVEYRDWEMYKVFIR